MKEFKKKYTRDLVIAIENIDDQNLQKVADHIIVAKDNTTTIYLMGNGGSSATPSHSAGDWSKELGIKTICLTDNIPSLTAYANDTDYSNIFKAQLEVFLKPGDIVIGYSGSGNSENVINAINYANLKNNLTIGITGNYNNQAGGKLKELSKICIFIDTISMEIIEDGQLIVNHMLKEYIKTVIL